MRLLSGPEYKFITIQTRANYFYLSHRLLRFRKWKFLTPVVGVINFTDL